MPLTLGAQVGDEIIVGARRIRVNCIHSRRRVTLRRDDGKYFPIYLGEEVEIFPEVKVSIGSRTATHCLRLKLDAPRTIVIGRAK